MNAPEQPDLPAQGQFLVYPTEDGRTKIEVRLEGETVWLTQQHMADLFQTSQQNISLHLQNIYDEGELQRAATHKEYLSVRQEGNRLVKRPLDFYNLDAIISVGYRVKSAVATRFRIWATQQLREFIVKGFVLDDERLKNPDQPFDYFDELLRRIQDIRTSERRFYQKITDIYATSIDYDPTQPESIAFFQTVQNKLHWAITGQTAAEIIHGRADSAKPNMGLTNWRGAKVRKEDVTIAKNYLNEPELAALNNLVEQYLVFAEGQAMRRVTGRFDFVLANPPFNVNAADTAMGMSARRHPEGTTQDLPAREDHERLKDMVGPARRFPFGLPRTDNATATRESAKAKPAKPDRRSVGET